MIPHFQKDFSYAPFKKWLASSHHTKHNAVPGKTEVQNATFPQNCGLFLTEKLIILIN